MESKTIFRALNNFVNNKFIASILFGLAMCLILACAMGMIIGLGYVFKFIAIFLFTYTYWYYDVPIFVITIFAILFYKMEKDL